MGLVAFIYTPNFIRGDTQTRRWLYKESKTAFVIMFSWNLLEDSEWGKCGVC
jgi:hypothetical protein